MKLGLVRVAENVDLPCALSFRSFIHSGDQTEVEAAKNPKSMDHEQVIMQESGIGVKGQPTLESEAGSNLRSMGSDQVSKRVRVNTRPPLENEAGMNLRYMDFDQVSKRERVNTRPPLDNEAGRTPMSMNYYKRLLQGGSVDGGPPLHQPEVGAGGIPRPMDDVQGRFQGRGNGPREGSGYYQQPQLESNPDVVHIKLMRNNSYVTLTDHKGDRKMSVSAGQVAAKGDKPGRYAGEAAAEYMGRAVKQMKIRSVVVKVSGFTYFRRKKDAILAFKDGYTHSRGDVNPVVYIEDTTRKPHNGCRLPKSRRI